MVFDPVRRRILRALLRIPALGGLAWVARSSILFAGETGIPGPVPSHRSAPSHSLVVRCRRDDLVSEAGKLNRARLEEVLGTGLSRAVGEKSPVAAMRRLFRSSDVVGLKLNCLAGRGPNPMLVKRLCDWVQDVGVRARNIIIWERGDRELAGAGFPIVRSGPGVRCTGTSKDYDRTLRDWGPGRSRFARLLVEELTALINVSLLKDHDLAGVSVGLKTWYGAIHNPEKHHDDRCSPFIPHLAAHPLIRDKLRITVIDATRPQCHGGPVPNPKWQWTYGGVLVSTDPVSIDAVGWRMIEERRRVVRLPSLAEEQREPTFIAAAGGLGLGEADLERIEIMDA